MLIESTKIRDLLNTAVLTVAPRPVPEQDEAEGWREPESYKLSLNPIPALVILLVGIMMSSHQQETMIYMKVHFDDFVIPQNCPCLVMTGCGAASRNQLPWK